MIFKPRDRISASSEKSNFRDQLKNPTFENQVIHVACFFAAAAAGSELGSGGAVQLWSP